MTEIVITQVPRTTTPLSQVPDAGGMFYIPEENAVYQRIAGPAAADGTLQCVRINNGALIPMNPEQPTYPVVRVEFKAFMDDGTPS